MDLPCVDLIEQLHEDKRVEDDGVVLGRWWVERSIAAAVDVEDALAWKRVREDKKRREDEPAEYITMNTRKAWTNSQGENYIYWTKRANNVQCLSNLFDNK